MILAARFLNRSRTIAASAWSIALVVALSGCASEVTAPTPTATVAAPSPTATPVAEVPVALYPAIEISCDDFELDDKVSAALGSAAQLSDTARGREYSGPDSFAVTYAGGIQCYWLADNGDSVSLEILPNPGTLWAEMGGYYSPSSKNQRQCSDPSNCMADPITENDVWISMALRTDDGATDIDKWNPIVDRAIEIVSSAPAAQEPWMPQAEFPITSDCPTILTDAEATTAFKSDTPLGSFTRGGGWSLSYSASVKNEVYYCLWAPEQTEDAIGSIEGLEGGAWAFQQTTEGPDALDREPLELEGLAEADSAWFSCDYPESKVCTGELVMGGNWISVKLYKPTESSSSTAAAVLQTIVDKKS